MTRPVPRGRRIALSKVTNARDALADFDRGKETFCLTYGQFSLMDAVEAILEKTGPADVAISTWTAGNADLSRSAEHLHNGNIRRLRFVCDCSFGQRQPGYLAELVRLFGEDAIRTTRTHAKFVVITNDAWTIAVRTSMNLNENPRLENIEVSDDPALAGFLLGVVDEVFAEEATGGLLDEDDPGASRPAGLLADRAGGDGAHGQDRSGMTETSCRRDGMPEKVAAVWDELVAAGYRTGPGFEAYCAQVLVEREASAKVASEGTIVADAKGCPVPHPALEVGRHAQAEIRAWGARFAPRRR